MSDKEKVKDYTLARIAHTACCLALGTLMNPTFDILPQNLKDAWDAAAKAVQAEIKSWEVPC